MPSHAGFAVALTFRERVLNDSILLAHHANRLPHSLMFPIPDGPPNVEVDFFLDVPRVQCSGSDPAHLTLQLRGWGNLSIHWSGVTETRKVRWDMRILIHPRYLCF